MDQLAYNRLLSLINAYNDNIDFLSSHSETDDHYVECRAAVESVDTALASISRIDSVAAKMIKEMFINGERIKPVAKRHHQTMQSAVKRMSHAMIAVISTEHIDGVN